MENRVPLRRYEVTATTTKEVALERLEAALEARDGTTKNSILDLLVTRKYSLMKIRRPTMSSPAYLRGSLPLKTADEDDMIMRKALL